MKTILAIAKNTFRETVRDRILLLLVAFGVMMVGASILLANISAGQETKIIVDTGLGMIDLLGLLVALFVGTQLIFREINQKTILLLLSKPINKRHFLLGKFAGLGAILVVMQVVMLITYLAVVAFQTDAMSIEFLLNAVLISSFSLISLLLFLAVALFFSSFMSPTLAAFASIAFLLLGHVADDFKNIAEHIGGQGLQIIADVSYTMAPPFAALNLKNFVLHGVALVPMDLAIVLVTAFVWLGLLLSFGGILFAKKEF